MERFLIILTFLLLLGALHRLEGIATQLETLQHTVENRK